MMGIKLLILQFIVFLTVFGQFTTADKLEGIYPDVRNCFKGRERQSEDDAAEAMEYFKNTCKAEIPDENSICFKYCLISGREMIWPEDYPYLKDIHELDLSWEAQKAMMEERRIGYNYTFHPGSVSRKARYMVGIEWSDSHEAKAQEKRIEEVAAKCIESSFIVPKAEFNWDAPCTSLAPINQENLGKLLSCFEDVLKEC